MKLIQIRNATLIIKYQEKSILVDPMLAAKGTLPKFRYFDSQGKNPQVDLPANFSALKEHIQYALITHCQKGHIDHLDSAGRSFLRSRQILTFCDSKDEVFLSKKGLRTSSLALGCKNPFFDGEIELVPAVHTTGFLTPFMEHGVGYFIKLPGEKSLYIMGDTILTDEIRNFVSARQPDFIVAPTGKAQMNLGAPLLLTESDIVELGHLASGKIIANHMEALDHCRISRGQLLDLLRKNNLTNKFLIPADGEEITI